MVCVYTRHPTIHEQLLLSAVSGFSFALHPTQILHTDLVHLDLALVLWFFCAFDSAYKLSDIRMEV